MAETGPQLATPVAETGPTPESNSIWGPEGSLGSTWLGGFVRRQRETFGKAYDKAGAIGALAWATALPINVGLGILGLPFDLLGWAVGGDDNSDRPRQPVLPKAGTRGLERQPQAPVGDPEAGPQSPAELVSWGVLEGFSAAGGKPEQFEAWKEQQFRTPNSPLVLALRALEGSNLEPASLLSVIRAAHDAAGGTDESFAALTRTPGKLAFQIVNPEAAAVTNGLPIAKTAALLHEEGRTRAQVEAVLHGRSDIPQAVKDGILAHFDQLRARR